MSRHIADPIKTFSITLPEQTQERETILRLTNTLNTEHHESTFEEKDFWTLLPSVMAALDDPTLDISSLFLYKMAQEAGQSVNVLLSSEGGHEKIGRAHV